MSLPAAYRIEERGKLLRLFRNGEEVYACRNAGSARGGLEEVAEWHHKERVALIESWKAKHGSSEQERWEGLRKEAEKKMLEAMAACMGARQWS